MRGEPQAMRPEGWRGKTRCHGTVYAWLMFELIL